LKKIFTVSQGEFELDRYPNTGNDSLQAFDAADEYILDHLSELDLPEKSSILIFNDSYGALTCALNKYKVTVVTDSFLSQRAVMNNIEYNNLNAENVILLNSLSEFGKDYDLVIIKIPIILNYLEFQLLNLSELNEGIPVIGAAMARYIHRTTIDLFEKYLQNTETSLAKKKARLFFANTGKENFNKKLSSPAKFFLKEYDYELLTYPNVFSGAKLDIGTQLFLKTLPEKTDAKTIVDLGCGNGIIGIHAANKYPDAHIIFIDESYMAVEAAKESIKLNKFSSEEKYKFIAIQ
jgi:23S rRNA (guanine1835-N2)-methyltransferase